MHVLNEFAIQVTGTVKNSCEIFHLVIIIKNLDHIHFLVNGELMERKLPCPKTERNRYIQVING